MPRLAALPLCVCLVAPLWAGCQSTTAQTARVDGPSSTTFWSADGSQARTRTVSRKAGETPTRLVSRSSRNAGDSLGNLMSGGRTQRVPLPRTAARDIDSAGRSADQPIGAF